MKKARKDLILILQAAYSGEMGAALAYRGHWKSIENSAEKERIKQIETEEWAHREIARRWLRVLGAKPKKLREVIFWTIGKTLGSACFISGWFFPMYFAGLFESDSVKEYSNATRFAREIGFEECAFEMIEMAKAELEHETFFRSLIEKHPLFPLTKTFFKWG